MHGEGGKTLLGKFATANLRPASGARRSADHRCATVPARKTRLRVAVNRAFDFRGFAPLAAASLRDAGYAMSPLRGWEFGIDEYAEGVTFQSPGSSAAADTLGTGSIDSQTPTGFHTFVMARGRGGGECVTPAA